jgi:hypothetical protein
MRQEKEALKQALTELFLAVTDVMLKEVAYETINEEKGTWLVWLCVWLQLYLYLQCAVHLRW